MTSPDFSDLLLTWRERRARGEKPSAEELCADCPELASELARQIKVIDEFEALLGVNGHASATVAETLAPGESPRQVTPPASREIPGYELLEMLGEGGMGVVYKARQVALDRLVALKMMAHARPGSKQLARFQVEAAAVARLQHPNIVQVYDVGESGGHPYFSMEYVQGGNLAQRLAIARPTPRRAAELIESLARAMHAAHEHGIVHRDLKPANVLLAHHERGPVASGSASPWDHCLAKISDFGLAKRLDDDSSPTQTGEILGTPSYMAPEQAEGRIDQVGPATDVYALGAMLYELLTGRPPFSGPASLGMLQRVVTEEPARPGRIEPQIPRDLEAICLKCLEKSPGRRYASAAALAQDLHCFLVGQHVSARHATTPERAMKWSRRHPAKTLALLIALAGLGLVISIVGANLRLNKRQRQAAIAAAPQAREILTRHCFECHGFDPSDVKRGLQILNHDILIDAKRKIVTPFSPERSRIVQRIEDGSMPPEEEELRLPRVSDLELAILKTWIAGGAPRFPPEDEDHPTPPVVPYSDLAADAKQVFVARCYECHRSSVAKGGIKILNHDLLVTKREMISPGRPDDSPLFQHITSDGESVMPPPPREHLSDDEIKTIRRWIEAGAPPFPKT